MKDVKAQCCLIQLKVTEQGTHTFELPQNIRRQTGKLKTRRDLWTTLFMGNQMAKYYFDMFSTDEKFNYDNKWCPYIL